jgi:HK97 family phage major capsid protein
MNLIEQMKERRAAIKASLEALLKSAEDEKRGLSEAEDADYDAKVAELRAIDVRIDDLIEAEKREAAAAKHIVETQTTETRASVVNEPNPVYRKGDASASFFRDKALMHLNLQGSEEARGRLARAQETRALSTTANAGGQFAPPLWLIEDFVALARAARVTADLMNHDTLPSGVSSINLPTVATGTTTAIQSTQNSALSQTDLTTGSVTSGISTIGGKQVVSMQLLQQSGIPFDRVVLGDLARSYATQLDLQVISGSGSSGQLRGLLNGSGVGATTFTSASPAVTSSTAANSFYNKIISAIASVNTQRYLPPTAIIMHPVRWGWVLEGLDSQSRPLVTPHAYPVLNSIGDAANAPVAQGPVGEILGLPVYVDPNIPQNLGAGTNEDRVFVLRADDCWLYESELQSASFDATYADQASILFRVLGYSAFIPDRYGKSVNVIAGTGLITPTL